MPDKISPTEYLRGMKQNKISGLLDVRSEGEFSDGNLPLSVNEPILNNEERHLVGTEYKKNGQSAAIELGISLTSAHRATRVEKWQRLARAGQIHALTCWRGGLRSKISQEWLKDKGCELPRIEGGYKSVRGELLRVIADPPPLIILGGWTGSGKTKLLQDLKAPKVDLEGLAVHRGSCFGEKLNTQGAIDSQPKQATFENNIAYEMWEEKGPFVVEDESTRIGNLNLPQPLKEKMKHSDVVFIEASEAERAENIYQEYIGAPIAGGVSPTVVAQFFLDRLKFLKKHLGGLEHDKLAGDIREAFQTNAQDLHLKWIERLLVRHYDKAYEFSFERLKRKVIFRGPLKECREFLETGIVYPG